MAGDKTKAPDRRYFAQVGSESIEVSADDVSAHADGAHFSTSKPVAFYRARAVVDETTYEGMGNSWEEAEASLDDQLPKVVKS